MVHHNSHSQIETFALSSLVEEPSDQTYTAFTSVFVDFSSFVITFICSPRGLEADKGIVYVACNGKRTHALRAHPSNFVVTIYSPLSHHTGGYPYSILMFSVNGACLFFSTWRRISNNNTKQRHLLGRNQSIAVNIRIQHVRSKSVRPSLTRPPPLELRADADSALNK